MKNAFLIFSIVALLSFGAQAQQTTVAAKKPAGSKAVSIAAATDYQLDSKLMARQMPYRVLLPKNYQTDSAARFPVLYLLHGYTGNYKNWTEQSKLTDYAQAYNFIVVTVEGGNGWYTDSATKPADKYESYIIQELIPEVDRNFRTVAEKRSRAVAGLSMGGFGALKFAAKYPEKFVFAGSLSGAVQIASYKSSEQLPGMLRAPLVATFGEASSQTKQSNDLFKLFGEVPADKIAALPFIYLDCGTEDELQLLAPNQRLAALLLERKIPHEFRQLPGGHKWNYWDRQVQDVLRLSQRFFNLSATAATAAK